MAAEKINIRIMYRERRGGGFKDKIFKDVTLEKLPTLLQEIRQKGEVVEVFRVDGKGNPIVELSWKQYY